jgi:hypothetical protein
MTHEFKPGDKVRLKAETRTVRMAENKGGEWQLLHLDGGDTAYSLAFELVEPSVTHRELREVLEELTKTTLKNDFNAGWNDALDAFFTQATGEQP